MTAMDTAAIRTRLSTKEGRIEAITQRAYSRRFGSGNSNYIRECADDEYELLGFLADAEAALDAERAKVRVLRNYLWRIHDAVMHVGGWCYDYETAEGARIAEAVNAIWREARDAGHEPFPASALAAVDAGEGGMT